MNSRPYSSEVDYAWMRELLIETFASAGPPDYCSVGDLDWWRHTTGETADAVVNARLWFVEPHRLIGFAWPGRGQVDLVVHPLYRTHKLENDMLAWAEHEWRGPDGTLITWAYEGDQKRVATLRKRGYACTTTALSYNFRELMQPLPVPVLPPGYTLRNVCGEADVEQRVAVHRNAFAPSRMTVTKYRAVMAAPTYRSDLDLVVVAPNGCFAAFCIVWYDAENQHGIFEPVGCHVTHRQRGLGKALMLEGLRRLVALGARTASVNSHHGAFPANRLYQSMGFHPLDLNYAWEKRL